MITIFERSDHAQGRATKAWLDDRGIPYEAINTTEHPGLNHSLQALGYFAEHVVEVHTGEGVSRFERFRPDLLEALCTEATA